MSTSKTKTLLVAGLTALTLGGTLVAPTSAEAGPRYGYGYGHGYGHGYGYGGHYRPHYGYGYRPAYYGGYRRHNTGAAVAAGLIGGLALGALAAQTTYARPVYYGGPAYYGRPVYGGGCFMERRIRYNRWGERVIRDVRICR